MKTRLGAIDGMRGLAMLAVILFHVWEACGKPLTGTLVDLWLPAGRSGVDVFIVLSGFCLMLPLLRKGLHSFDVTDYASRRARRILPAYYAALAWALLLPLVFGAVVRGLGFEWRDVARWDGSLVDDLLAHIFLVHNWSGEWFVSINDSLWTMGLEAQFYLAFPVIVFGLRRYGLPSLYVLLGLSLVLRLVVWAMFHGTTMDYLYSLSFLGRFPQFVAGVLAVWFISQRVQTLSARVGTVGLLAATAAMLAALGPALQPVPFVRDWVLGAALAVALVLLSVSKSRFKSIVDNRACAWLGSYSYSLYLVHLPIVWMLSQLLTDVWGVGDGFLKLALLLPLSVIFTLLCGIPFSKTFERGELRLPAAWFLPLKVKSRAV